jgi:hypothetical protein
MCISGLQGDADQVSAQEERNLMDVSELEQELACNSDHGLAYKACC